jgi:hypothetical protein
MALSNTQILPRSPNLPIASSQYSQQYTDEYSNVLRLYFNQLDNFNRAILNPNYGTTQNRPTFGLLIGQTYFDTTLNIPIWYNGSNWVNASGTTV